MKVRASLRMPALVLAAVIPLTFVVGCENAVLSIETVRLGQASSIMATNANPRGQLASFASRAANVYASASSETPVNIFTNEDVRGKKQRYEFKRDYYAELAASLNDPKRTYTADELNAIAKDAYRQFEIPWGGAGSTVGLNENAEQLMAQASQAGGNVVFGGYQTASTYMINPGSAEWEKALQYESQWLSRKLVFSRIQAIAPGDATLMITQESPGQFEPRYMETNPEESIRNGIIVVNRVLRAAAKSASLFRVAIPGIGGSAGQTSISIDEAQQTLSDLQSRVKAIMNDAELNSLLDKMRKGIALTDADRAELREKVMEMQATFGNLPIAPAGVASATQPSRGNSTAAETNETDVAPTERPATRSSVVRRTSTSRVSSQPTTDQ